MGLLGLFLEEMSRFEEEVIAVRVRGHLSVTWLYQEVSS